MHIRLHAPVAVQSVRAGTKTELTFVPCGELRGEIRSQHRFYSAESEASAHVSHGLVVREHEIASRIAVPLVNPFAYAGLQHAVQRNSRARVEEMIRTECHASPMTQERLVAGPATVLKLVVPICESTTIDADAEIGVRTKELTNSELAVDVNRRNLSLQHDIGIAELRSIEVIVAIHRKRHMTFERPSVPCLDQITAHWIELRIGGRRKRQCGDDPGKAKANPDHKALRVSASSVWTTFKPNANARGGSLAAVRCRRPRSV